MSRKRPEIEKEYMEILRPCLHFHGIQIKSIEAFGRFAAHVDAIEETVGIRACTISLEEIFVCPDIVWPDIKEMTPMEKLLFKLIAQLS